MAARASRAAERKLARARTGERTAAKPRAGSPAGRAPRDGIAELDEVEAVFSALAHPQRRQILLVLHARGDRVRAGAIAERFACSWPTTTRHLRVLEDAGLIAVEREGRERLYRLDRDRLERVVGGWLGHFSS